MQYLSLSTIDACLKHNTNVSTMSDIPWPALLKTGYTWPCHMQSIPPDANLDCSQCHLYCGVTLGVLDDLHDLQNYVSASQTFNGSHFQLEQCRSAGFFQLYQGAIDKEHQTVSEPLPLLVHTMQTKETLGKAKVPKPSPEWMHQVPQLSGPKTKKLPT